MIYLAYALIYASAVTGCVVLGLYGHPWLALAVLLVGAATSMTSGDE